MTVKMRWGVSDTSGKRSRAELESKWFFCSPGALTHERGMAKGAQSELKVTITSSGSRFIIPPF